MSNTFGRAALPLAFPFPFPTAGAGLGGAGSARRFGAAFFAAGVRTLGLAAALWATLGAGPGEAGPFKPSFCLSFRLRASNVG